MKRRKRVKYFDGVPHVRVVYTTSCSGCFEFGDYGGLAHNYPYDEKAGCHLGFGCSECGYSGERRHDFWMPDFEQIDYEVCDETGDKLGAGWAFLDAAKEAQWAVEDKKEKE